LLRCTPPPLIFLGQHEVFQGKQNSILPLLHQTTFREFSSSASNLRPLLLLQRSILVVTAALTKSLPAMLSQAILRCPAIHDLYIVDKPHLFPKSTYLRVQASKFWVVCLTSKTETSGMLYHFPPDVRLRSPAMNWLHTDPGSSPRSNRLTSFTREPDGWCNPALSTPNIMRAQDYRSYESLGAEYQEYQESPPPIKDEFENSQKGACAESIFEFW
jgi:hypothetical protein